MTDKTLTDKRDLLHSLAHRETAPATHSTPSRRPPSRRMFWLVLGALSITAASTAASLLHKPVADALPAAHSEAKPLAAAATAPLAVTNAKLEAAGFVTATRTATVSARTMGVLQLIRVNEGDHIAKNQVIAQLDDTHARIDFEQAQANASLAATRVRQAEIEAMEAERVLARERTLVSANFSSAASLTRLDTALQLKQVALDTARQELQVARIAVQRSQAQLNEYTIRAPFAGVVLERNAQEGETIAPSSAGGGFTRTGICTIADIESLELVVDINEEMIDRVKPQQRISAIANGSAGKTISGKVLRLEPAADRAKATVKVRIQLAHTDATLLPGMSVRVSFL
ncbi:efflux RND transporter periplasmic adaptor subunit [Chitinimonas sp.]|uniref:efflux RND transporter periplasmic adaptor subunit n=1 Tax=Chitinimonas sp. TaxID=1934313 RepID=UPI0035AE1865